MKTKNKMLVIILALISISSIAAQAQTKTETVSWLKTYMIPELNSWNTNINQKYHSINSETFIYCRVAYYSQYCKDQYTIDFKNIKHVSNPYPSVIKLSGTFNYQLRDSYNDGKLSKDESVNFVEIKFLNNKNTEEEDLNKIIKALTHLAELNGAQLTDAGLFDN